ncbi:MAG: thiamine phosphate synthase [Candidatus Orphnella occulta]|nr:thiamine phosphate synthase [Candidatus Orphnella occulta]
MYLVLSSEYAGGKPVLEIARSALVAGVDILQMREKGMSEDDLMVLGRNLLLLCREFDVPFIVNDNPYLARNLNADGVHLGQEDIRRCPLFKTRDIIGQGKIIGISTHSIEEFRRANSEDFDYIAFGPIFPTKTKNYSIGTDDVEQVLSVASKPVIFIGGINLENVDLLLSKGARSIATIRAIIESDDIAVAVNHFRKKIISCKIEAKT